MVNIAESKVLIMTLLSRLPCMFEDTKDVGNCLGTAVRAAHKLIVSGGGRGLSVWDLVGLSVCVCDLVWLCLCMCLGGCGVFVYVSWWG